MTRLKRRAQPMLGTFVEIAVPSPHAGAMDMAFAAIRQVHNLMSFHDSESDIGRINRARVGEAVLCDRQTIDVIRLAKSLYRKSGGLFDICTAPRLVRDGFLPSGHCAPLRSYDGCPDDIELLDETGLRLHRRVLIDLGGIAKGHGVDQAINALRRGGVPAAMVNAGGDLRYYGDLPWPVRMRRADGSLGAELILPPCAIASSANAQSRKRRLCGVVTPHIGLGGKPVRLDRTVSVTASSCIVADALTKVAMTDAVLANRILAEHGGYVLEPSPKREEMAA